MSVGTIVRPPRPAPTSARPYRFPQFVRGRLDNGMQMVVARVPKLPIVTVLAVIEAGAIQDPPGRDGLARLTAALLPEGTEHETGNQFAEHVERLGASVDAHADWDVTVARITVLTEHLGEALRLFGKMLRRPAFPVREVERLKAERLAELLQTRADPGALADEMFTRFVYAADARYSRPVGGRRSDVESITREDIATFYSANYRPATTTLVAAGDVTVDQLTRVANVVFGDWADVSGGGAERRNNPDDHAALSRGVHIVGKADAPQTELRIGHPGIPRRSPDYFPVVVMNAVLGGLFSSRINLNLREAHGYTYGAFSSFDWRRHAGPFSVDTAVKTAVTGDAVREILNEIDRIRDAEIHAEELSLATSYLDGVFPIRYETTDAIAIAIANLVIYGLDDDYFDRYRDRVRAVEAVDVLRVAREYIDPGRVKVVAVGDVSSIRGSLAALDIGPLRVYDADGAEIA